jgi:hypothetical protein
MRVFWPLLSASEKYPILVSSFLGVFTWLLWPGAGWLWAALAAALAFKLLEVQLSRQSDGKPLNIGTLLRAAANGLSYTALSIALGIGVVVFVQFFLLICSQALSSEQVLRGEEHLSMLFQALSAMLSLQSFLSLVAGFALLNFFLQFCGLLTKAVYSSLSRVVFGLISAISFAFAATETMNYHDPDWQKAEYGKGILILKNIKTTNKETIAALWLENQIRHADADTIQDYKNFFQSVSAIDPELIDPTGTLGAPLYPSAEAVRDAARSIARNAPGESNVSAAVSLAPDRELMRLEAKTEPPAARPPAVELRQRNSKLAAARARYADLKETTTEEVTAMFMEIAPRSERALVRAFVREVASRVAGNSLDDLPPYFAPETSASSGWDGDVSAADGPTSPIENDWNIGLRPLVPAGAGHSSATAMAMLAGNLKTNAAERASKFATRPEFFLAP